MSFGWVVPAIEIDGPQPPSFRECLYCIRELINIVEQVCLLNSNVIIMSIDYCFDFALRITVATGATV